MTDKKTSKPVDISDFDTGAASDKGFELELRHPTTDKPLGTFITVLGKHSAIFREHIRDQINERQRREAAAERKGKSNAPVTAEEIERQALELLVICTIGWRNMNYKGEELPFSEANALKVYSEQIWVRGQVDEAIGDLENFMKG